MYGLPQAGYLAQKELVDYLATFDYFPFTSDPCLFCNKTNGVAFTLVVDDFLIKNKDRASAIHLLTALQKRYPLKSDWSPWQYLGIDIAFDKRKRTVRLSIPGYIPKMLRRFDPGGVGILSPQVVEESTLSPLDVKGKTRLQEIVGVILYSKLIDSFIATAVDMLSEQR